MTTDDLDERLRSHGDAWRARDVDAPSLDAMLDVATGRRMRWQPWLAVAAGVLVVAAVAAIPIARHAQHDNTPAAASPTPSDNAAPVNASLGSPKAELNATTLVRVAYSLH
jgi:hypothetical protein